MRGHASRQEIEEPQQVLGVLGEQHRLRIGVVFHIYMVGHIACYSKTYGWAGTGLSGCECRDMEVTM